MSSFFEGGFGNSFTVGAGLGEGVGEEGLHLPQLFPGGGGTKVGSRGNSRGSSRGSVGRFLASGLGPPPGKLPHVDGGDERLAALTAGLGSEPRATSSRVRELQAQLRGDGGMGSRG